MKQIQLKIIQGTGYLQVNGGKFESGFGVGDPIFSASVFSHEEVRIELHDNDENQFEMVLDAETSLKLACVLLECYSACREKERALYESGDLP